MREHIKAAFGDDYLPEKPNVYKTKADAQDAHEAIRPTSLQHDPETVRQYLTPDQYSLYRLIWNRFVASQMPPATFDETTVDITAGGLHVPRQGHRAEVRRLDGDLRPDARRDGAEGADTATGRRRRRRRRRRVGRAAAARRRRSPRAEGAASRAEVHAAAAALLRSDAGQGARGKRHRPPEHLRVDHRRAAGPRVRRTRSKAGSSRRRSA